MNGGLASVSAKRDARRLLFLAVTLAPVAAGVSTTQGPTSVWSGVYAESQAVAGEKVYADYCAKCHGQDLAGIERSPALAGLTFAQRWHGATLTKLYERIEAMPPEAPKSLTAKQYVDVLAFLLRANEYPAGQTPLAPDQLALVGVSARAGSRQACGGGRVEDVRRRPRQHAVRAARPDQQGQFLEAPNRLAAQDGSVRTAAGHPLLGDAADGRRCALHHGRHAPRRRRAQRRDRRAAVDAQPKTKARVARTRRGPAPAEASRTGRAPTDLTSASST